MIYYFINNNDLNLLNDFFENEKFINISNRDYILQYYWEFGFIKIKLKENLKINNLIFYFKSENILEIFKNYAKTKYIQNNLINLYNVYLKIKNFYNYYFNKTISNSQNFVNINFDEEEIQEIEDIFKEYDENDKIFQINRRLNYSYENYINLKNSWNNPFIKIEDKNINNILDMINIQKDINYLLNLL